MDRGGNITLMALQHSNGMQLCKLSIVLEQAVIHRW